MPSFISQVGNKSYGWRVKKNGYVYAWVNLKYIRSLIRVYHIHKLNSFYCKTLSVGVCIMSALFNQCLKRSNFESNQYSS